MKVKHRSPYFVPREVERVAIEHMCKRDWPKAMKIIDKVVSENPDRLIALERYWLAAKGPWEPFFERHISEIEACINRFVDAKERGERWPPLPEATRAENEAIQQVTDSQGVIDIDVEKLFLRRRHQGKEYLRLGDD